MLVTHSWLDGPMSWQHQNQNKPMGAYDPASNRSDSESPTPQTIRDCWGDAMAMGETPAPGATFTAAPFFGGPPEAFGSALGGARAPSSAFSSTLSGGILPPLDMGLSHGFRENKSSSLGMFSGIFSAGHLPPLDTNLSTGSGDALDRAFGNQLSGMSKTSAGWSIELPSIDVKEGPSGQRAKANKDSFWNSAFMDELEGHSNTPPLGSHFGVDAKLPAQVIQNGQDLATSPPAHVGAVGYRPAWNQPMHHTAPITPRPKLQPSTSVPGPKKRTRKVIPEVKEYVDKYNDLDCLFGRGGRSNHHPGNQRYLDLVNQKKPLYRSSDDKKEKRQIIQDILEAVWDFGGRFLELDQQTNRWYVSHPKSAYGKVGQALRDRNDPEARLLRREKYGPAPKRKKRNDTKPN